MSRWVFDIETNGLLKECTRMWILAAFNLDTRKMHYWVEGDLSWKEVFNEATLVVGHNVIGFDILVLEKLFGYKFPKACKVHDTLIMSQVLDYKRFGSEGHSLAVWGQALNFPKHDFNDWSKLSQEMIDYCLQDVKLGVRVYEELLEELINLAERAPQIKHYMKAEHAVAKWAGLASLHGWPFDLEAAQVLYTNLEAAMQKAYDALSERLGSKTVATDKVKGVVETKMPKWTKQGFYDAHTARWFGIDPCSGYEGEERLVAGEYCRVEFQPLSLDSVADVKTFLYRNGWEPTEWNYKPDPTTGKKVKTSPKVTEDSLEFLGGDGKLYTEFLTAKSRFGILKTWVENTDENGMLHGDCMTIGTPSMRSRHSIIVNVPSADSPWGKEMRQLFSTKPGWKLIGCDSAGNQARGLAHYLGDAKFIDTLINGDIHQYNADILTQVVNEIGRAMKRPDLMVYVVKRPQAKRILYAFLFGASGAKLWSYIFGSLDDTYGKKLRAGFLKAVPGFKALIEKLENIFGKTSQNGDGYIPSIAGNRIYVDSFHKLLVYLLQSCEKATCSAAVMLTMERLEEANIPYIPLIMMHDEEDFMVPEEHAEQAAKIGKQAFIDGPRLFGIQIMDGDAKIGNNWYEIH
ncbi:DNA polymerase [Flavobacterium sp.]|jgi:DNA polymerase-1|uniref:DNA polymerase n=1 Tax=Flavobacterium sp. TaxID=239 RepID=UPI0037BEE858